MELVHKQPVRWTHDRIAVCDGGDGPAGHPRIFINTDKAEISVCNYCGLPFVRLLPYQIKNHKGGTKFYKLTDNIRPMSTIGNTSSHCPRHHTLSHRRGPSLQLKTPEQKEQKKTQDTKKKQKWTHLPFKPRRTACDSCLRHT